MIEGTIVCMIVGMIKSMVVGMIVGMIECILVGMIVDCRCSPVERGQMEPTDSRRALSPLQSLVQVLGELHQIPAHCKQLDIKNIPKC